jgi:hypothetical protein
MARLPVDAQGFKPSADLRAVLAVLVRKPKAKRPVREADFELLQRFLVVDAPAFELFDGVWRFFEPLLIVADYLLQELLVIGRVIDRRFETRNGVITYIRARVCLYYEQKIF